MPVSIAYLSLGSNLGDRGANLRACIARLDKLGKVAKISSLYETEPMEFREQPWFLNCVVELETPLTAHQLLAEIEAIEEELGRTREIHKGPRTIDIDIVLFGDSAIGDKNLKIPHPAMRERRFVLEPLAEIAPQAVHPVLRKSARELLAELNQRVAGRSGSTSPRIRHFSPG